MSTGVVYFRPQTVCYVRQRGPYAASAPEAWRKLLAWADAQGLREGLRTGYGLVRDNPRIKAPADCRYDACIEVPEGFLPDEKSGVAMQLLPGGSYARHRHLDGLEGLGKAFGWLARDWTAGRGLMVDAGRPFVEIYLKDPKTKTLGPARMDICVPVTSARKEKAA
jgi:AraC family transcriptional regulator